MPLVTAGRNFIAGAIIGEEATLFDEANAHIGVGDSDDGFDAADTDLQAAVNKERAGMDANYPTLATNVITFKATFGADDANFDWNEWAIFNAAAAGTMLCRLVEDNGTKAQGQPWVFEAEVEILIGTIV